MKKNLIIGFASNYEWKDLQYWVNSIQKTDFSGDICIVSDNIKKETIEKLVSKKVELALYGKRNDRGDFVAEQSIAPHVNRFFYIWNTLKSLENRYRFVVTTDVRDVIFQTNPIHWLDDYLSWHSLVASSEGIKYQDEPWGNKNLYETFGPYYHNILKEKLIYNVGVIGGEYSHVCGLMSLIFQMSINRPIQIVDQAVYNFILNTEPFQDDTLFTTNINNWAIQLGTTIHAVQAGSGDLGQMFIQSPNGLDLYREAYADLPVFIENEVVMSAEKTKYPIVHQWDRIPELKTKIQQYYGDTDVSESRTIFHHPV